MDAKTQAFRGVGKRANASIDASCGCAARVGATGGTRHLSVEEPRASADTNRHFGLEAADVDELRTRLEASGGTTEDGRSAPWKRFFVRDPFGNRIEIQEPGAMRS